MKFNEKQLAQLEETTLKGAIGILEANAQNAADMEKAIENNNKGDVQRIGKILLQSTGRPQSPDYSGISDEAIKRFLKEKKL